ncbi:unnamed protein product [Rangifer tarandus platyrhynchus]|uniref:Uncharacterized protein n=1 Tax=Rangifer tarandus platyrhynchus TaxID=3082113 RepID=A0ABN8ZL94_RANTA|nr:unnamed protein product [Rangifer tarandus platyrhynchus]
MPSPLPRALDRPPEKARSARREDEGRSMVSGVPGTSFRGSSRRRKGMHPQPSQPTPSPLALFTGSRLGIICHRSVTPYPQPKLPGGVVLEKIDASLLL